jgi:hypothetical protein
LQRDWARTVAVSCWALDDGSAPILPAETCTFCAQSRLHVGRHQRVGGQFRRVHPDAHRVFRAEHLQAADASTRASGSCILLTSQSEISELVARRFCHTREDQQEAALRFLHRYAGLLDFARQARFRLLDFVLHLHLGGVRVGPCSKVTVMLTEPSELLVEVK